MFEPLVVLYLFLGGTGAGALATCAALDLFVVKQPFGSSRYVPGSAVSLLARALDFGFAAGLLCLVVGLLALAFDLGRIDRALSLLLDPHPTLLTLGTYALAALAVLATFAAAVRFVYLPSVPRPAVAAAEALSLPLALVVMLYTGLLLATVGGVPLWSSPLVPVLFLLSSCSCGLATLFLSVPFVRPDAQAARVFHRLLAVDAALVAAEVVCAVAFVLLQSIGERPGTPDALAALLAGNAATAWWLGFVVCGLAAPLAFEACALAVRRCPAAVVGVLATLVLVGGFCLRWSLVEAADHRSLVLEQPQEALDARVVAPASQPAVASFTIRPESIRS